MTLRNRVALITGSSSGIGRGVALAMAAAGADIIINHPSAAERDAAEQVAAEVRRLGRRALVTCADISEANDVELMVAAALAAFGKVDILVNNAGIAIAGTAHEMPIDLWDRVIAVHLRGTFLVTRAVLPHMYSQGFGRIINTASQLAYKGAPGFSAYTAAKGGILSFTRAVALEIGARDITINCVAPGATHTPILADVPVALLEEIRQAIPLGRIAEVADIAPSYVFLASDAGRHYQGQCISPNGGDVFL
ncbi:MAG: SDR family oxidoreductase [Gammaproteobacteria bacterium]|nr:SDR family oxidoreductase [Gammaproteobacteria bacterium]